MDKVGAYQIVGAGQVSTPSPHLAFRRVGHSDYGFTESAHARQITARNLPLEE